MLVFKVILISLGTIILLDIVWQLLFWIFILFTSLTINFDKEYSTTSSFYNKVFVLWYRYMLFAARLNVHMTGYEKIPFGTRFMLVSNHRSKFDNFIQAAKFRKEQIAYISKPENFKIPMGKRFMKRNLYLPIQRGNPREGLKTILKAVDLIKEDKVSIGIFPEGTRSKDGTLLEFKPGCFKISEKAKCPIVVCCMQGTEQISKNWPWKKTDIYMDVLEVIEPSVWEEKSTVEIASYTHELIFNNIK